MITKWDIRGMQVARLVASWSKDPSTQVGAYLTDEYNRCISFGFNGFPPGVSDLEERLNDRATKLKLVKHAEDNAIAFAGRSILRDCNLYVWPLPPCAACAGAIVRAKIPRIVSPFDQVDNPEYERWQPDWQWAFTIYEEASLNDPDYSITLENCNAYPLEES